MLRLPIRSVWKRNSSLFLGFPAKPLKTRVKPCGSSVHWRFPFSQTPAPNRCSFILGRCMSGARNGSESSLVPVSDRHTFQLANSTETDQMSKAEIGKVRNLWALANEQMERDVYYKQRTFEILDFLLTSRGGSFGRAGIPCVRGPCCQCNRGVFVA